jgi:dienelactone hydrolase
MWRRERLAAGIAVAAALGLAACTGGGSDKAPGSAAIRATPRTALMDVPVQVSVTGLRPGSTVTVSAETTDGGGVRWSSRVDLAADANGTASLDRAPTGGSYTGAEPMGLFTTMTPDKPLNSPYFTLAGPDYRVTLKATADGRQLASTTVVRQAAAAVGVHGRPLDRSTGLHATLYLPTDTSRRRPALLAFGGSEGGEGRDYAASMFAAHGYPVLSLAYFGASRVPATLERIPLEYFARAAALLARQPGVDPRHVLGWGVSRGGEAALLLGVHYPQLIHGVIATSTSDHVYAGLPDQHAPAWTLHGRPLPFGSPSDFWAPGAPNSPASVIPVERIAGPVITVCGAADLLIPSCPFAEAIAHRRGERGTRLGDIHLVYPRSGHLVGALDSYFSATTVDAQLADGSVLSLGGTIVDNAEDAGTAHSRLLAFLAALQ